MSAKEMRAKTIKLDDSFLLSMQALSKWKVANVPKEVASVELALIVIGTGKSDQHLSVVVHTQISQTLL